MILIGEKLNSSIPRTRKALETRDEETILRLIAAQVEAGATYLDLNTALLGQGETDAMQWLLGLVLGHNDCGVMLDSPNPAVVQDTIGAVGDRPVIVNSVTLCERMDELLPTVRDTGAGVVALPIDTAGVPADARRRADNCHRLVERITAAGVPADRVYLDVLAQAVAMDGGSAVAALETLRLVRAELPGVHTICGLSNVSFGLPKRAMMNNALLVAAIAAGMDSVILDPTNASTMDALVAAEALVGRDEYCMDYLTRFR